MQALRPSEVIEFSGGVNTVQAPYLIAPNESVVLANSDVRKGALWARKRPLFRQDVGYPYFFFYNNKAYQYAAWRSNVIWDRKWYYSDGAVTGKVYPDGQHFALGLPSPNTKLTVDIEDVEGPLNGDYKYTYTFYDSTNGVESAPAPLGAYVRPVDQAVKLSGFEEAPANSGVDTYRIYRIGGYYPYFVLVDEVPHTVDNYTDSLDDTEVDGRELQTLRNGPPPQGLHYLTEYNGRLYGAVGSKLYFSALGNPDSWYIFDWIPFRDTITGIAKGPGGLLVMGVDWTYSLRGTDPLNFRLIPVSEVVGCAGAQSINYIKGNAVWLSDKGLVTSDGYRIELLTQPKVEEVSGMKPTGSASVNDVYYMSFKPALYPEHDLYPSNDLYPAGVQGTNGIDQGLVMMDFKRGRGYSYQLIDMPDIQYVDIYNGFTGVVHGRSDESMFPVCDGPAWEHCLHTKNCSGYALSYLDRTEEYQVRYFTPELDLYPSNYLYPNDVIGYGWEEVNRSMPLTYISPLFVEGSPTTLKEYEKVRITFRGVFNVKILLDNDEIVQDVNIISVTNQENDSVVIGIPNERDRSYSIRFLITGAGVIRGIQWTYQMRNNV